MSTSGSVPEPDRTASGESRIASLGVAISLLLLSIYILITAARMPNPDGWGTAPSLLPLMVSFLMFFVSGFIIRASLPGRIHTSAEPLEPAKPWPRALTPIALVIVFIGILLPLLPFEVAAILFLLTTCMSNGQRFESAWEVVAIVIFVPLLSACFSGLFDLATPGNGSLILMLVESFGIYTP